MSLLLLSPRLWLAIGLAAVLSLSHLTVYRWGKKHVKADWVASVAASNAEALRLERARQSRVDEAARTAAAREAGRVAALARLAGERDGLRDERDAARQRGAQSLDACRAYSATLDTVFGQCVQRLEEVARDAAGHASDSLMLQESWPR